MQTDISYHNYYEGLMVWNGKALQETEGWIAQLDTQDVASISSAVAATRTRPLSELSPNDFDFGNFGNRLQALRDEVLQGKGFVVLHGLPGNEWSDEELVRAYWGIGQWFGDPVSQNAKAHLLGHVIDQRGPAAADTRIYQTNRAQPFHSDSCDIVGLLCLRKAKAGGTSAIASSAAIYNHLLAKQPAMLRELCGQFQCDRYGEIPAGKLPWYTVRVFNHIDDNLVCCGMDPDIRSAQRLDNVTPLTASQAHALDAFQDTARELALNMTLERGDIQLVNNHVVVHARGSFEDYEDRNRRRYMARLWLSSPLGRELPDFLSERWGNIKAGTKRGGISVPGAKPVVYLDPDH